jgi:hypothetical protein
LDMLSFYIGLVEVATGRAAGSKRNRMGGKV